MALLPTGPALPFFMLARRKSYYRTSRNSRTSRKAKHSPR